MFPPGIKDIDSNSIIVTREYLEQCRDNCIFTAQRAKEQGDAENFAYYNGRAGVFDSFLYMWEYRKSDEEKN